MEFSYEMMLHGHASWPYLQLDYGEKPATESAEPKHLFPSLWAVIYFGCVEIRPAAVGVQGRRAQASISLDLFPYFRKTSHVRTRSSTAGGGAQWRAKAPPIWPAEYVSPSSPDLPPSILAVRKAIPQRCWWRWYCFLQCSFLLVSWCACCPTPSSK